ncbi:MAG: L-threonylcarbamoyladenylate synthase [Candidatus Pacearchaeota archaeon]
METMVLSSKQIKEAASLIKKGELVAFPTETVYGLGANALNPEAVKKIFIAKGRPSDNPLIVHICSKEQLNLIAKIPKSKEELLSNLIKNFWPGPLTLILKRRAIIPNEVTAGLDTVAIRMPKNKIALKLIKFSEAPIAAPSANISGKPSGTKFSHVFQDFNGRIAGIIKGGKTSIGLESTVIDLTSPTPYLLRPGAVTFEELSKIIPKLKLMKSKVKKFKSPGMKYKHYSPNAKVILFEDNKKIKDYKNKYEKQGKRVFVLDEDNLINLSRNLFDIFRECDKNKIDYILVSSISEKGIGLALKDRIKRASYRVIT